MIIRISVAGAALFALSACGGGGSSDGGSGVDLGAGDASYSELQDELPRLSSYFASTPTADGNLPTTDTVNYDGIILYGADLSSAGTGYLGQVDIDVDFTAGSRAIDGAASNFYETNLDSSGDPSTSLGAVGGSLTIDGGNFATNSVTFDVDGTVDGQTVDGTMNGQFASTASNSGPVALVAVEDTFFVGSDPNSWNAVIAAD